MSVLRGALIGVAALALRPDLWGVFAGAVLAAAISLHSDTRGIR